MKGKLVRWSRHQGPMSAVLERYGIGTEDKYGRGIWISSGDLSEIEARMRKDRSRIVLEDGTVYVQGTNMHNHVCLKDFQALWAE